MGKLKIGVLYTHSNEQSQTLAVLSRLGHVQLINPGQKANVDVLIIPDKVGISPFLAGVQQTERAVYISATHQVCMAAEYFRISNRGLSYYLDVRGVPIIGVGQGSAMLWSYLGGNIAFTSTRHLLVRTEKTSSLEVYPKNEDTVLEFNYNNVIFGVETITCPSLSNTLYKIAKEINDVSQYPNGVAIDE